METLIDLEKSGNNHKDFFDYFDKIYVINLKRREDRLEMFSSQMKEAGVDFTRIEAVDGEKIKDKIFKDPSSILEKYSDIYDLDKMLKRNRDKILTEPGIFACAESHRLAILKAKEDGSKRPLILEDDASLTKALFHRGTQMINEIKDADFDMVNLGIVRMKFDEGREHFSGSGLLRRLEKGVPTKFHAYTVNPEFYDEFLRYSLSAWEYLPDIQVTSQCLKNKKDYLAIHPRPFTQLGDYSDLREKKIKKGGLDEIAFRFPHQAKRNDSYF
jgi:GR25 family glycosyltransferase involved in LPS biosynthesis